MLVRGAALAGLLAVGLSLVAAQEDKDDKGPKYPAPGALIPGPLVKVLNTTGERKGRYHCLIVRNALHPVAAIFAKLREKDGSIEDAVKKLDADQPIAKLFKKLDTVVDENLDTHSAAFAVMQVEPDEKKAEEFQTMKKQQELEKELELKRLVFGVTDEKPLHLPEDTEVFVLLYRNHRVVATRSFTKDKPMTDKDVDEIVAAYKEMVPKVPKRVIKIVE
jgi:hypothetical protein